MKSISFYAFIGALGVSIYILMVATFMNVVPAYLQTLPSILGTTLFLSTFVFSAAVTSTLVFGRPIVWYLDGRKKEAVTLLISTLGIFLVITIVSVILSQLYLPDSEIRIVP